MSNLETVYSKLKTIENIEVYKKNEIPDYYNYKHNRRVGDILVTAKLGYTIYLNESTNKLRNLSKKKPIYLQKF